MLAGDYLDLSLGEFLERLAAERPAPGGGSAAALTVTFAAGLVAMVARCSRESWPDAAGVAAQARALQARTAPLVRADAEAWEDALAALRHAETGEGEARPGDLEEKLALAAEIPVRIAETAADVAALGALAAELGEGAFRADAAAAAVLADAGARVAVHLVEVNLGTAPDDPRLQRARASREAAAAAVARALDAGP